VPGLKPAELPAFDATGSQTRFIDLFTTGNSKIAWSARTSAPWIKLSQMSGSVAPGADTRLLVSIAPSARKDAADGTGSIFVHADGQEFAIKMIVRRSPGGLTRNGVIAMPAESARLVGDARTWKEWDGLGIAGTAVEALRPVAANEIASGAPHLEFQFSSSRMQSPKLLVQTLPTFATSAGRTKSFAVSLDGGAPVIADAARISRDLAVLSNAGCNEVQLPSFSAGRHRLRIWALDRDLIFQQFTIRSPEAANGYPSPRQSCQ
jgi:hypothetical protein